MRKPLKFNCFPSVNLGQDLFDLEIFNGLHYVVNTYSSFPVIPKVGSVYIFTLPKFRNKLDIAISHMNINLMYHNKI